jgi:23S rRNA (uridine2552-2'-O)-methyltransferase
MIVLCSRQILMLPSRGCRKHFEVNAFWFSSKSWMQRHKSDSYVKLSVANDLRSRSAFKLIQIQEEYNLIKPDSYVIDLGSSPGGWSVACAGFLRFMPDDFQSQDQIHHQRTSTAASVAPKTFGLLCSVDLLTMKPIPGDTHFIQGDFRSIDVQNKIDSLGRSRGHNQVIPA